MCACSYILWPISKLWGECEGYMLATFQAFGTSNFSLEIRKLCDVSIYSRGIGILGDNYHCHWHLVKTVIVVANLAFSLGSLSPGLPMLLCTHESSIQTCQMLLCQLLLVGHSCFYTPMSPNTSSSSRHDLCTHALPPMSLPME